MFPHRHECCRTAGHRNVPKARPYNPDSYRFAWIETTGRIQAGFSSAHYFAGEAGAVGEGLHQDEDAALGALHAQTLEVVIFAGHYLGVGHGANAAAAHVCRAGAVGRHAADLVEHDAHGAHLPEVGYDMLSLEVHYLVDGNQGLVFVILSCLHSLRHGAGNTLYLRIPHHDVVERQAFDMVFLPYEEVPEGTGVFTRGLIVGVSVALGPFRIGEAVGQQRHAPDIAAVVDVAQEAHL